MYMHFHTHTHVPRALTHFHRDLPQEEAARQLEGCRGPVLSGLNGAKSRGMGTWFPYQRSPALYRLLCCLSITRGLSNDPPFSALYPPTLPCPGTAWKPLLQGMGVSEE